MEFTRTVEKVLESADDSAIVKNFPFVGLERAYNGFGKQVEDHETDGKLS